MVAAKRESNDNFSALETKIHELEKYIVEKSCFGLIMEGNETCDSCSFNDVCPDFTDERLVREEKSLWEEETEEDVNKELEAMGAIKREAKEEKQEKADVWSKAIARIVKEKPKTIDEAVS